MKTDHLELEWTQRHEKFGATRRSVLFKRMPGFLNDAIHRGHVRFLTRQLAGVADNSLLLDVGCGYGRIAAALKQNKPNWQFQGIDLCTPFAEAYRRSIGPCFNGPVQDFNSEDDFDAIVIVTLLMYLDEEQRSQCLSRLWSLLAPGGRLLCIEPAVEFPSLCRRLLGWSPRPTGDSVKYFTTDELQSLLDSEPDAEQVATESVWMLPFWNQTAVHHCVAWTKRQ